MAEPMSATRLAEIQAILTPSFAPLVSVGLANELLAEVERLVMELSKCSESFDSLSLQYHEARERWKQSMQRVTSQVAAMRPIVTTVAERWDELTRIGLNDLAAQARDALTEGMAHDSIQ